MKIQLKLFEIRSNNNNELYKDVLSAMAYNKVALKRLVLKRGTWTTSQGKVAKVVNKACDRCYYLSLETMSYQSPLSCHTR